ncbi:MAG: lytic transglycosylase domain-containing protein [Halanaerobiales bacterium]
MDSKRKKYKEIIRKNSSKYNLPSQLVYSIIKVESDYQEYSIRYEKQFKWLYKPDRFVKGPITLNTEENAQKTSWGLMQLMGATARELGFDKLFLPELLKPEINIKYGCKYLAGLRERYKDLTNSIALFDDNMVAAYNAGSPRKKDNGEFVNQEYVDKILKNWS